MDISTLQSFVDTSWFRAVIILAFGYVAARVISRSLVRYVFFRSRADQPLIIQRIVFIGCLLVAGLAAMSQLGFDVGVLLGAAGVATVAVGFAAQTSFSNIISGLFLVGERPFNVGDTIEIGTTIGTVESIDLLSMTLRTPQNLAVRVPNELLLRTEVTNYSRFPIRRVDLPLTVAYRDDLSAVRDLIHEVVSAEPLVLEDPAERVLFTRYAESVVELNVVAWVVSEDFLDAKARLALALRRSLSEAGFAPPLPERVLRIQAPGDVAKLPLP